MDGHLYIRKWVSRKSGEARLEGQNRFDSVTPTNTLFGMLREVISEEIGNQHSSDIDGGNKGRISNLPAMGWPVVIQMVLGQERNLKTQEVEVN